MREFFFLFVFSLFANLNCQWNQITTERERESEWMSEWERESLKNVSLRRTINLLKFFWHKRKAFFLFLLISRVNWKLKHFFSNVSRSLSQALRHLAECYWLYFFFLLLNLCQGLSDLWHRKKERRKKKRKKKLLKRLEDETRRRRKLNKSVVTRNDNY